MFGFELLPGDLAEECHRLIQREASAHADIENFAGNVGRLARQDVRVHCVLYVREVTRLFSIAKNNRLALLEKRRAELCEHTGVRGAGVLPRPKNIKITQRDVFHPIAPAKGLRVKLTDKL